VYLQLEVREDEEQGVKMGQIIELLLAAGYFRVRIKGLSSFDKVTLTCLSIVSINRKYSFVLVFI